jgi:glucuronosyltransferase
MSLFEWVYFKAIHFPIQRHLYQKYFPDAKRSMDEMYKNYSFVFMNQHVSFSSARPYLPTMIEVGGIHVKPAKKLPEEFEKYLDSATDGVILFSMGSYIDGIDWKIEDREAFIKIFGKLKQKVIWRYSNETLPGNPGNIKISSWLPQRDILAHPNVKLFITHGGLLGTTEALVEGVPVLGKYFKNYFYQFFNGYACVSKL